MKLINKITAFSNKRFALVTAGVLFSFCSQQNPVTVAKQKTETKEEAMTFKRIGVIHSPYTPKKGAPRQGALAPDVDSTIVVDAEYEAGLKDIETFSHVIVLYAFDRSKGWSSFVKTPWEKELHGVFATRSPRRPNPIGMTVVNLIKREGNTLHVKGLDAFDGTLLLDLKPYIPRVDVIHSADEGWLGKIDEGE